MRASWKSIQTEAAAVQHQVAAVEIAMAQHARPGGDLRGQAVEPLGQRRPVLDRQVASPEALQEVLLEVVQLPGELLDVEGDLEAAARCGRRGPTRAAGRRAGPAPRDRVDRAARRRPSRRTSWSVRSPRSSSTTGPAGSVVLDHLGNRHPEAVEQGAHAEEGQLLGVERLRVEREDEGPARRRPGGSSGGWRRRPKSGTDLATLRRCGPRRSSGRLAQERFGLGVATAVRLGPSPALVAGVITADLRSRDRTAAPALTVDRRPTSSGTAPAGHHDAAAPPLPFRHSPPLARSSPATRAPLPPGRPPRAR